jgi:hypothetical protein
MVHTGISNSKITVYGGNKGLPSLLNSSSRTNSNTMVDFSYINDRLRGRGVRADDF